MSDERAAPETGPSDTTHLRYLGAPAPDDPWSPDYVGVRPVAEALATRDTPARRIRARVGSIAAGVGMVGVVVALVVVAFAVTDLIVDWSRTARLRDVHLVADQVLVEVVSPIDDGTDFIERAPTFVLDIQSGEVITEAGGDLRSTDLVGVVNGLVVPRLVSSTTRLVGVGLDGTDLWQLPPGEVVAIGDEVVVTIETTGPTSVVRAYASA